MNLVAAILLAAGPLDAEQASFRAVEAHDVAALSRLLADDFVHVTAGAPPADKKEFLRVFASLPVKLSGVHGEELHVKQIAKDVAVVTGVQVALVEGAGKARTAFTDVFVLRKGRWLISLAQSVDLP